MNVDDEIVDDIPLETSHPDIDSALEMHLGSDDFSYKTRTVNESTQHLVMRLKKGLWKVHFTIDDEEVKAFDSDELATFLIHQVSMNRAIKRRLIGFLVLFFVIVVPVALYSVIVLGIGTHDDFEKFLIAGGLTAVFIPVFCILLNSAERSVDRRVYNTRHNFIDVLQKMMDLKETPYQKRALEQRLQRLQNAYRTNDL
jgi:hypothetical protein